MSEADRLNQAAPDSNPGSADPSAGIASGSGGVSSAAYVLSPVPSEQSSVVQQAYDTGAAAVETIRSYLPSLASLSLGGGKAGETGEQEARDAGGEDETAATGGAVAATAAVTAAAASTAAAITGKDAAPTDSADPTASASAKDEAMADSNQKDDLIKTDEANERSRAMGQERSSDIAPSDREKEESAAKTDTAAAPPGAGNEGEEMKPKPQTGGGGAKENRDAIPTAGGQRLGDKHWGESKIVGDAPPKRESVGGPQVSSTEGQPDKATQDNTAQNTGGAAPPSSADDGGEEGKTSMKDKIKEKLNIGQ